MTDLNKVILRTVIRRFLEFFFWEVLLSVVVTALATAEGNTSRVVLVGISFIGVFVYAVINVLFQRWCCLDLADKKLYYKTNYTAYFIFVLVNMICLGILDNVSYTWMFAITKGVRYLYVVVPVSVSALLFHIVMLYLIYISPYGMEKALHVASDNRNSIKFSNDDEDNEEEDDDEELFNIPEDRRRIID